MERRFAIVPGDGIGVDVTREAVKILEAVAERGSITLQLDSFDYGADRYLETGETLSDKALAELATYDGIFMGAFGDPQVTGKPVGADLREGKPTPLLARAVRRASPSQRDVLDLVGDVGIDDATVARIQQVIHETGALDELEAHITDLAAAAVAALAVAPITPEAVDELTELADYVSARST